MKNKIETSEVKAHAKYSASGSERWLNCPGSIELSKNAPPQPESKYAIEGTKAHACLEFMLKMVIQKASDSALIPAAKKTGKWDAEMMKHAHACATWLRSMHGAGSTLLTEQRIDASSFTCADQFGTLDAAIVEEFGTLTVVDFKYGQGVIVDPKDNSQLIYYALGLSEQYYHNFEKVRIIIDQPRAYTPDGVTRREWECSMDELLSWRDKFKKGVEACEDPLAPLKCGDWCRWCPAQLICPEAKNAAMERAQIVFDDATGVQSMPEPVKMQVAHLGVALAACDQIEAWISKLREHAIHVLERGETIDGFKLVAKRSIRKWADPKTAASKAQKLFGSKAFTKPELLSPAQLEKALDEKGSAFCDENTTSVSSGTTLAVASDPRPAVNAIENAFGELPPQLEAPKGGDIMAKKKTTKKAAKKNPKK